MANSDPRREDLRLKAALRPDPRGGIFPALYLVLSADDPAVNLWEETYEPVFFYREPREFTDAFLHDYLNAGTKREKRSLASYLAGQILPERLRKRLGELAGRFISLHIDSDEAWIPWEILGLELGDQQTFSLGRIFAISRGVPLHEQAPIRKFAVEKAAVVFAERSSEVMNGGLQQVLSEHCHGVEMVPVEETPRLILGGDYDLFHFLPLSSADHHRYLFGGCHDLKPSRSAEKPLMVFSDPRFAQLECRVIGRLGGPAVDLLQLGAGGVVAPLFPLTRSEADQFFEQFYRGFFAGRGIGDILSRPLIEVEERKEALFPIFRYFGFAHSYQGDKTPIKPEPRAWVQALKRAPAKDIQGGKTDLEPKPDSRIFIRKGELIAEQDIHEARTWRGMSKAHRGMTFEEGNRTAGRDINIKEVFDF